LTEVTPSRMWPLIALTITAVASMVVTVSQCSHLQDAPGYEAAISIIVLTLLTGGGWLLALALVVVVCLVRKRHYLSLYLLPFLIVARVVLLSLLGDLGIEFDRALHVYVRFPLELFIFFLRDYDAPVAVRAGFVLINIPLLLPHFFLLARIV